MASLFWCIYNHMFVYLIINIYIPQTVLCLHRRGSYWPCAGSSAGDEDLWLLPKIPKPRYLSPGIKNRGGHDRCLPPSAPKPRYLSPVPVSRTLVAMIGVCHLRYLSLGT